MNTCLRTIHLNCISYTSENEDYQFYTQHSGCRNKYSGNNTYNLSQATANYFALTRESVRSLDTYLSPSVGVACSCNIINYKSSILYIPSLEEHLKETCKL